MQISFLIFQFDHFGRWVPKKYFTLICYDSRNTNLQPLVIYISWFLQRKSQAYSLTTVCDKSCHTFSTYMPRCNIWFNNNRNKPAYTSLSLQVLSNVFYCLPYSSCDGSLEDLVLDQLANPWLIFFSILITCLLDILPYLVSHGNFEIVKVLKITVICKLADATWLLYKIEFHKSQKFHGFLNVSIMEGNYCK